MNGVRKSSKWKYIISTKAAIGIGALIVFISLVLVAGIGATVIIQTMGSLEEQAMRTGVETIREVSSGLKITHVSGYNNGSKITQLVSSPLNINHSVKSRRYLYTTKSEVNIIHRWKGQRYIVKEM